MLTLSVTFTVPFVAPSEQVWPQHHHEKYHNDKFHQNPPNYYYPPYYYPQPPPVYPQPIPCKYHSHLPPMVPPQIPAVPMMPPQMPPASMVSMVGQQMNPLNVSCQSPWQTPALPPIAATAKRRSAPAKYQYEDDDEEDDEEYEDQEETEYEPEEESDEDEVEIVDQTTPTRRVQRRKHRDILLVDVS